MKFEKLTPFVYKEPPNARFELTRIFQAMLGLGIVGDHVLRRHGKVVAKLHGDLLTVLTGLTWDGATPKWLIFGLFWFGVPDFKSTRLAVFIHDIMCEWLQRGDAPFTRKQADKLMRHILKLEKSRWRWLFYFGVTKLRRLYLLLLRLF